MLDFDLFPLLLFYFKNFGIIIIIIKDNMDRWRVLCGTSCNILVNKFEITLFREIKLKNTLF